MAVVYIVIRLFPSDAHYVVLAIGGTLLARGILPLRRYRAAANWVEVPAVITRVEECEYEIALSESVHEKYLYPSMEYEYRVDGRPYRARTVSFEKENVWVPMHDASGKPTAATARWWLAMAPGSEVPAFINPRDVSEAVLVRALQKRRRSHHLALAAAGALLIGVWVVLAASR